MTNDHSSEFVSSGTSPGLPGARLRVPPFPARKRGKRMSRRNGQDPTVRVGKRADGTKYYFFQFWTDVPGQEERKRMTEVIGLTSEMTKSEAERKFFTKWAIPTDGFAADSDCWVAITVSDANWTASVAEWLRRTDFE
jgi:hypothetical protein